MTPHPAALTARPGPGELLTALAALGVLLAAVIGLPVLLYLIAGLPVPHHAPSPGQLTRALLTRDDTTLFLTAADLTAWAGWAVFTGCTALETAAVLTGRLPRRLPALAGPQHLAAGLVTAAAVLLPAANLTALTPPPLPARPAAAAALTSPVGQLPSFGISPAADTTPWAAPGQAGGNGQQHHGAAGGQLRSYVVRRGDTLWGIASRELGDPEEWKAIAALNYDRPQPAGAQLTDSHWIYPGWTLLLPHPSPGPGPTPAARAARAGSVPPPAPAGDPPAGNSPAGGPGLPVTRPPAVPADAPAGRPAPTSAPGHTPAAGAAETGAPGAAGPVALPDAGLVSAGFAAGIALALGYARRRQHRGRVPQPPAPPVLNATDPLLTPTVRRLVRAATSADRDTDTDTDSGPETAAGPAAPVPAGLPAGTVELGVHAGRPVRLDLLTTGGLMLTGPGRQPVARALLAGLLTTAGDYPAVVLAADPVGQELLTTATGLPAMRTGPLTELLTQLDTELLAHHRLAAEHTASQPADQPDPAVPVGLGELRAAFPGEPLPLLLLTADTLPAALTGRLAGLLGAGARHGLTALLLQPDPPAGAAAAGLPWVHLNQAGTVTATNTSRIPAGARLYRLNEQQTGELLALTARAHAHAPPTHEPEARTTDRVRVPADPPLPPAEAPAAAEPADLKPEPQPETPAEDSPQNRTETTGLAGGTNPTPVAGEPREKPDQPPATPAVRPTEPGTTESGGAADECGIVPSAGTRAGLRVFGPVEVHVDGQVVSTGLRSKARELLALLAVHPGGLSADRCVDALFPDAPPGRGHERFRTTMSNLRLTLAAAGSRPASSSDAEPGPPVLDRDAGRYRLNPAVISVDLWDYTAGITAAAHARRNPNAQDAPRDGSEEREALSGAAALYRGEFAHGAGYDWAEPVRQELRASTSDALVRLADLHTAAGDTPGRIEALNQAVNTDPDEEALYQALMRAHAETGDLTGVRAAYRKLQTRLDDLGVDPDPSTETLLTQLLGLAHPRRPAAAHADR